VAATLRDGEGGTASDILPLNSASKVDIFKTAFWSIELLIFLSSALLALSGRAFKTSLVFAMNTW
jgi:hypothetical protein